MIKQQNDVNWDKMNECAGGDLFIANTNDVEIKNERYLQFTWTFADVCTAPAEFSAVQT